MWLLLLTTLSGNVYLIEHDLTADQCERAAAAYEVLIGDTITCEAVVRND